MSKDINGFFPIKILFLGTSNVGKTSLIKRLTNREDYKIDILHNFTISLNIYLKAFQTEGQLIKCELWDTPGIFGAMNDNLMCIKYVNVLLFIFDLSSKDSFSDMKTYFNKYKDLTNQLKLKNDAIIIGNKLDKIKERQVSFEEINNFAMENNVSFFEISAKDNKNGYNKLFKLFEGIAKNYLEKYKIIRNNNNFDIIKYRYISKRDENAVKPSLIYKQVDIFVKTLSELFPVEDYILQIINDINDFYKSNIYKKISIQNFEDLKFHVYNLEILRGKLIDIFKIVALKINVISQENYQLKKKSTKKSKNDEKKDKDKSLLETDVTNNEMILLSFIKSNSTLRKAIHYCIHDYIINFIFDFNNENILEKRLKMIIKEDSEEEDFVFKYFCDVENKKKRIIALFNDNYVNYFSSSELHQYYLFIRQINYLFDYLSNLISEKSISTYFEKGENAYNSLKEYISANNKDWENVKNENIKNLSTYDIEKNILHFSKKFLKYLKYELNQYNINFIYNKGQIFDCIKIRLHSSIAYNLLNKKYESILYFYSSFLLITRYIKNKNEFKENNKDDNFKNKEKEIFDLFNQVKEKLSLNIPTFSFDNETNLKEIKRKLKYHLNNSIEYFLLYNQQNEELKINTQTKGGKSLSLKNPSNNKNNFDFFSFPSIILKIYKSLGENVQVNEKLKTKIKLYEIYSDSLTYYKREQYNIFFKCLTQKYYKNECLLSYDGKNINSLKLEKTKIENILSTYDFLPSDIAQFFNIIGIALMLLFRRMISNDDNESNISLYKKHKELVFMIFNAGLNENLIEKANELDLALKNKLRLEQEEKNYRFSLEQIRNCLRINISMLLLTKDYDKTFQNNKLIDNSLYISNDFPINYPLENLKEFLHVIYIDSIKEKSLKTEDNNYFNNNILNIFPNINNYEPCLKNKGDDKEYLNYFIELNDIDEFDLINVLMANSNKEAFKKGYSYFITPQNFKEKFTELYNKSTGEEKELFNNILTKENLGNIDFWRKKFDSKLGKGFVFNPIYKNYISKYYNFEINLYIEEENNKNLKLLETTSIGIGGSRKYKMNLICNKDMSQVNKVFIPLIDKTEISNFKINNTKEYFNNLLNKSEEYNDLFPHFSNLLLWQIMNVIKITLINDKKLQEIDEEIIQIYLDIMFKLGLYEQIIHFINENINTILKNDKKYFSILFKCYKRLCLYDNCIDSIKKYLYKNNSSEKDINYETVKTINKLQELDFINIYNYYKNLEKERPIIFVPPLMDEESVQILKDKVKNADDNIFNLEVQLAEEKIEKNQKAKLLKELDKLSKGNKFRILFIEGGGIKSLIQLFYLCEIENYYQKPISQIFNCIITSGDGIIICGLLSMQNEKGEIMYHANDILNIYHKQKETLYNNNLQKELKIDLLRKLFKIPEIIGNLYFFDQRCQAMLKIGNTDLVIDLYESYIDWKNDNKYKIKNDPILSFNNILSVIPKNFDKDNLYLMNLGNGMYPFNSEIENLNLMEQFFFKQILGEQYLNLDIQLNTCKDEGKYSLQSLDNQYTELFSNCVEYFSEIKENNNLFTDKLDKFFVSTNS